MKDKKEEVAIFDVLKLFNQNLKTGKNHIKRNISIQSEFGDLINESIRIEEELEIRNREIKELEAAHQLYAKRTRGRRRKRFEKAVLDSVAGAIINDTPGNITVNGSNFHPSIGQIHVLFVGGGTTSSSSTTSNAAGTQATVSVPAIAYGLSPGVSVAISVLPGNLSELESTEVVTTTVLAACGGG